MPTSVTRHEGRLRQRPQAMRRLKQRPQSINISLLPERECAIARGGHVFGHRSENKGRQTFAESASD
ncbi:hypothetical protein N9L68_06100 [bacterium]|nr:hypothetical protein [bacterium]